VPVGLEHGARLIDHARWRPRRPHVSRQPIQRRHRLTAVPYPARSTVFSHRKQTKGRAVWRSTLPGFCESDVACEAVHRDSKRNLAWCRPMNRGRAQVVVPALVGVGGGGPQCRRRKTKMRITSHPEGHGQQSWKSRSSSRGRSTTLSRSSQGRRRAR
jgi:hypothetical protein